ncbi:hypothetical protein ESZ50_05870 [Weissella muntiaci]|uniref:Immunity protein 63 domain-containing protein n=1 Tax=Weissella muntiaci TaxID=2508881 RepID=A0A6C2C769_9LACO|nr:Imm63 family immunity protein [Weissella muntiaci]TYC49667.1 hypothetical protein ESZ50_05870 [Weissella muntiaci]
MMIEELKGKLFVYGRKINLNDGNALYPHISLDGNILPERNNVVFENGVLKYIFSERGIITLMFESDNLDDFLFQIFKDITFEMALTFEVSNRVENQDFRRVLFSKQLEILNIIDETYKERAAQEIKDILKVSPFNDY